MDGYLLDMNIVVFMMGKRKSGHGAVWRRHDACPDGTPIYVSPVALGEFDVGCCLGTDDTETARQEIAGFIRIHGLQVAPITVHTTPVYGDLKARLITKYQRERLKSKNRAKWPEGWLEPSTGKELGIDENDLWIAAQAIERNLVLATQDSMARLLDVATELRIEDWTSSAA